MNWFLVVCGAAALVGFMFLLKRFVRAVGMPCQFCGNQKLAYFDQLAPGTQTAILSYFHEREKRDPDVGGLFICRQCRTVHDDFSGEKRSWDIDQVSTSLDVVVSARTFCKVCNSLVYGCDLDRDDICCDHCGTRYEWRKHEPSGFRFLTPLGDVQILKRCKDPLGIA